MSLNPTICYENLLADGTTTGDGTDYANAYHSSTATRWTTGATSGYLETTLGGSTDCDYFAVGPNTLSDNGGSIKLQYWTGAAYADIPQVTKTPTDGKVFAIFFPKIASTKFKVVVSCSTACDIAYISFGVRLEMERGITSDFATPRWNPKDRILGNVSDSGELLGRSVIRSGVGGTMSINNCTKGWVEANFGAFQTHSLTDGWFLLWSQLRDASDVAYCHSTATPMAKDNMKAFKDLSIPFSGVTE